VHVRRDKTIFRETEFWEIEHAGEEVEKVEKGKKEVGEKKERKKRGGGGRRRKRKRRERRGILKKRGSQLDQES